MEEEYSFEMNKFFYGDRWVFLHNSFSEGGSSVRTFWDPRSFEGEREFLIRPARTPCCIQTLTVKSKVSEVLLCLTKLYHTCYCFEK